MRFLRLAAGPSIREHRDYRLGFEMARCFHIPVAAEPNVEFILIWPPGGDG